jgi:hypothetical protein
MWGRFPQLKFKGLSITYLLPLRFPAFIKVERTGLEPVTSALSKQRSKPTELTFLTDKINEPREINFSQQATILVLLCHL